LDPGPNDIPPEAAGRLTSSAFSSGLSVNDFAACLHMGMRPVALVQGYCVMRWSWYGAGNRYGYGPGYGGGARVGYPGTVGGGFGGPFAGGTGIYGRSLPGSLSTYQCPHYYAGADHRMWGANVEQGWMTRTWHEGFDTAYQRMIEEAREAGAHGVIGVVDTSSTLIDRSIREFHIYGTGVVVEGEPRPERIWTSYLAGARLGKLVESGFMPVSIVASMASVRVWGVCVTEQLMRGGYATMGGVTPGAEITQVADAQMQARRLARDQVKSGLAKDNLHGADLQVGVHEMGEGDMEVDCILRGTRVHRFRPADPLPPPLLTVRADG
jgi:hypothetical protein